MKTRHFLILALACLPASAAFSQATPPAASAASNTATQAATGGLNILLKDGKTITSNTVRRSGANVMVTQSLGGGTAEVGYPATSIAKIEFPEPSQIRSATDLVAQGKNAEALAQIDPIVNYYSPFREISGSWWGAAAQVRLTALIKLQRETEAQKLIAELGSSTADPEAARAGKVQLAALAARKGDPGKALAIYDEVIAQSKSEETLALAWVSKGQSFLALKEWEPALLAFLHVPVYYPFQKLQLAPALLGSGQALAGIDDLPGAEKTFSDLIVQYPSSPEAATAKAELKKITKTAAP